MRLIIVSNRAPVSIVNENDSYSFKKSEGGLASGLGAYVDHYRKINPDMEVTWIGWPGNVVKDEEKTGAEILDQFGVQSVFLSEQDMDNFYKGFCNKTLWPLFHYFPVNTDYENTYWDEYVAVNYIFFTAVLKFYKPGDVIWVHDYHLMLLPGMLREKIPDASIGFFLHIPFPSYEIFRLLPKEWRKKLLEGLFGADLIGFHTFDYRTYFLRSTLNILGLTDHMGEIIFRNRLVKVDSFPMGIDYGKYHRAAIAKSTQYEIAKITKHIKRGKIILSIDRQDYTKGILNRLKAYEYFLQTHPQWKQLVTLLLVVIPSRIGVESYQSIKSQIDELVGRINGTFGTIEWQPIHYQYRSLSFAELIAIYNYCDVALITPLRDGMNLIAKEFVAARSDESGVLILSEMAGAAQELDEAILINPNNVDEISKALNMALEMNEEEQKRRMRILQRRVKIYNIFRWGNDFLNSLTMVKKKQERLKARRLSQEAINAMINRFHTSDEKLLFLDYDGTLAEHTLEPTGTFPDQELLELLLQLSSISNLNLVLISGRDRSILDTWFGHLPISLVAEHGIFVKEKFKNWRLLKPVRKNWKRKIFEVFNEFVEKLPGSFIEEKEYSIAYHFRKSDPAFAELRVRELINHMVSFISNMDVQLVTGSKVLEVRNSGIDKGVAAMNWLNNGKSNSRFVLAIGNDQTDEDLFRSLPAEAFSILVGNQPSYAKYNLNNTKEVREFLQKLVLTYRQVNIVTSDK